MWPGAARPAATAHEQAPLDHAITVDAPAESVPSVVHERAMPIVYDDDTGAHAEFDIPKKQPEESGESWRLLPERILKEIHQKSEPATTCGDDQQRWGALPALSGPSPARTVTFGAWLDRLTSTGPQPAP